MRLSLHEHPNGIATGEGTRVVYDIEANEAHFGAARVDGPAIVWELDGDAADASLSAEFELEASRGRIVRCDRIDFPPGGVAYRHTHPGAGIRRVLFGSIHIDADGHGAEYGPGGAWFEGADYPVLATAAETESTAFVRVMVLPAEWEGRRTIRYIEPADDEKPKLQRPTVFFDRRLS
jgi:quercetin dioxygenase-like cupin family protein